MIVADFTRLVQLSKRSIGIMDEGSSLRDLVF